MIFTIETLGNFNIRQFRQDDYLRGAAELIYDTDPFIYPYWQKHSMDFREEVFLLMQEDGFIFNYRNLYGVFYQMPSGCEMPVGLLALLDAESQLEYDYSQLQQIDTHHDFVITHYVEKLIAQRRVMPDTALLGVCLSIGHQYRQIGLAEQLLRTILTEKATAGYTEFHFDCLQTNSPAMGLYKKLGGRIIGEGIGFDGTENSNVKIYNMAIDMHNLTV